MLQILFWISLVSIVCLRLLSMWAFDESALKIFPVLRFFNPNNWIIFRALSFPAALTLAVLGFVTHSYGHALGNGFYALVALNPNWFQRAGQIFKRSFSPGEMFVTFGLPAITAGLAVSSILTDATPLLQLGYSLQAAGNVLMCTSFCAMMAGAWGPASAGSFKYLVLATLWDLILLVGVYTLWLAGQPVWEFVIFEICIILTESLRWLALARQYCSKL